MRNGEEADGRQNISMVIAMRIKMEGFLVFDYAKEYPAAREQLAQWLAEGKLQRKETIVKGGLKAAEQALVDLHNGINTGMSPCEDSRMRS
jgi:NADPH-dependent curcumin reductase CurA